MATVIAKNNLGSSIDVEDLGITFTSTETLDLTDLYDFVDLTESDDLKSLVSAGSITINDGDSDLSITKGLEHLEIESVHQDYIQDVDIGGGEITSIQAYSGVILTTSFQLSNTAFTTTTYESVEYENDTDVLEWDGGSGITIKEDGEYRVSTCFFVRANTPNFIDSLYRIMKNGSTAISSEATLSTYTTEIQQVLLCVTVPLVAGDVITTQCRCESGADADIMGTRFNITKNSGVKGDAGPAGGSTVVVQKDGTQISASTDVINFRGDGVVVTSSNSTSVNVDISSNAFEPKYIQVIDTDGGQDMNTTNDEPITWETQTIRDTDTFNHTLGAGEINILTDGYYEVSYSVCTDGDNSRKNVLTYIAVNDSTVLDETYCYRYARNNSNPYATNSIGGVIISLSAGDYIELKGVRAGDSGSATTIANRSWLKLKLIREA